MAQPEQRSRDTIDRLLRAAGWYVRDASAANIYATRGVAIREFPLKSGHGFADYLLCLDGKAAGVIEAKRQTAVSCRPPMCCSSPSASGTAAHIERLGLMLPLRRPARYG